MESVSIFSRKRIGDAVTLYKLAINVMHDGPFGEVRSLSLCACNNYSNDDSAARVWISIIVKLK